MIPFRLDVSKSLNMYASATTMLSTPVFLDTTKRKTHTRDRDQNKFESRKSKKAHGSWHKSRRGFGCRGGPQIHGFLHRLVQSAAQLGVHLGVCCIWLTWLTRRNILLNTNHWRNKWQEVDHHMQSTQRAVHQLQHRMGFH